MANIANRDHPMDPWTSDPAFRPLDDDFRTKRSNAEFNELKFMILQRYTDSDTASRVERLLKTETDLAKWLKVSCPRNQFLPSLISHPGT